MSTSTTDEIKGTFHEVKGKVKETAGQVTNNPDLEAEGKAEHRAGKVEKKGRAGQESVREINQAGTVRSKVLRAERLTPLAVPA
jgi:uncharacterized protein YjbJ (UPF0337 family)